jgi:pyruvate ferredoxin oxidoreductase gamma subunit
VRSSITEPDVVVVLDPSLLRIVNATSGLKPNGIVIINTTRNAEQIREEFGYKWRIATVGATKIAQEVLGVPITNTTMIGAVIKATGVVSLESTFEPLRNRFGRLGDRNIESMKRAYGETVIEEMASGKV